MRMKRVSSTQVLKYVSKPIFVSLYWRAPDSKGRFITSHIKQTLCLVFTIVDPIQYTHDPETLRFILV